MTNYISFSILGLILIWLACSRSDTELILLGTVHQPVEHFNSDSLYNILVKIDPDLILFEVDSSFFTKEFKFNKTWGSNENMAVLAYMNNHVVDVRPYDFTGRNEYRIRIGSRPTDDKVLALLDSLYQTNNLSAEDVSIYRKFLRVSDSLNSVATLGARAFNNRKTDSIAEIRQAYLYEKLMVLVDRNPIFANSFHIKRDGDSISYAVGYRRAGEFWHLRNKTMARNISHFTEEYRGKRIVVLNGYFHRYYLKSLLKTEQRIRGFTIRDFHEY